MDCEKIGVEQSLTNIQAAVRVQPIVNRLNQNAISLFREPFVSEYTTGDTIIKEIELLVQDPDGYLLRFSQEVK